ncbi:hypothetical protein GE21DRAFT_1286188 [Neurospora crassa]|nr:hypothetical protein GE21DRAFT_1286188 [Neurospora crassa]
MQPHSCLAGWSSTRTACRGGPGNLTDGLSSLRAFHATRPSSTTTLVLGSRYVLLLAGTSGECSLQFPAASSVGVSLATYEW